MFVKGDEFDYADNKILVKVPLSVLLGTASIRVERPVINVFSDISTDWVASNEARVVVPTANGFVAGAEHGPGNIAVLDLFSIEAGLNGSELVGPSKLIENVAPIIRDGVTTSDRSRAYFAAQGGVAVIDGVLLEQHDIDPSTPVPDLIPLELRRYLTSDGQFVSLDQNSLNQIEQRILSSRLGGRGVCPCRSIPTNGFCMSPVTTACS